MSGQLVCGEGDRVPQSGSTARCELVQGVRVQRSVRGEVLYEKHRVIHSDDEGEIVFVDDHFLQKLGCCRQFKRETVSDGVAGIDDETKSQRELGLTTESEDGARRLGIVANFDVWCGQVRHRFPAIRRGEKKRDLVYRNSESHTGIILAGKLKL